MGTDGITVRPVVTRSDHDSFCRLPYSLYSNDRHWVPPLMVRERRRWSMKHNASLRYRRCRRFLALRNGRVAGRIAATVDEPFELRWEKGTGFFGFFECEEDPEVARAMLAAVEEALRAYGKQRLLGPVNLTLHDEVGLLVDGFESRPMVLSPYNPPYYESLLVDAGLSSRHEYYAYAWHLDCLRSPEVLRLLERAKARARAAGVVIRHADARRWKEESRLLFELYSECFEDVWGFVPLHTDEYDQRAADFKSFYATGGVTFAEIDGRPIGFGLAVPDINEALSHLDGRLWPLGWLRLSKAIRRIRSARFILLGVLPEYRGRGIAPMLVDATVATAREVGIEHAELSLIQDTNLQMRQVVEAFGGRRSKTYRLYEKEIECGQATTGTSWPS